MTGDDGLDIGRNPLRNPLRYPHSIRFSDEEWRRLSEAAKVFEIDVTTFVRRISLKKLDDLKGEIHKRQQERTRLF